MLVMNYLENILKLSFLLDWHVSDRASEKISHLYKIPFFVIKKMAKNVYSEDLNINIILLHIPLLSCFISLNIFMHDSEIKPKEEEVGVFK